VGGGGAKDGKPWKFGQTLGKIKKIQADLSENMLKSGYFITILHKYSGKLSTVLPPPSPRKHQPRSPMRINGFRSLARRRKGNSLIQNKDLYVLRL
jgi:hypothetical protein